MVRRRAIPVIVWLANCFLALAICVTTIQPVYAQDPTGETLSFISKECNGVDVVVLIDQSSSMQNNDPANARFDAARLIIAFLGNHAVWLCYGQGIEHRLAVIGFGDQSVWNEDGENEPNNYEEDVETYLQPMVIPEQSDFKAWSDQRRQLNTDLNEYRQNRLGATDHKSALTKALDILHQWQTEPLPGVNRRQLVILITDGGPCQRSDGCGYVDNYTYEIPMQELVSFLDPEGINYPWTGNNPESIFLSVIAMTAQKEGENYTNDEDIKNGWDEIVKNRGSVFPANEQNTDLSSGVSDILSPIIGSVLEPISCDQELWVEPYVDDLLIFYIFTQGSTTGNLEDVEVTISIAHDSETILVSQGRTNASFDFIVDYQQDGPNEFYVFSPSVPGQYRIQANGVGDLCQDVDARLQRNSITAALISPEPRTSFPEVLQPPYFREGVSQKFEINIKTRGEGDQEATPLVEYADYPLTIKAYVESEAGDHRQELDLELTEIPGTYVSKEYITTPIPGRYNWYVKATASSPRPDRDVVDVFGDQLKGYFTVGPVDRFGFVIQSPSNGDSFALNDISGSQQIPLPIPVTVILTDNNGLPIPASPKPLKNTDHIFEAKLSTTSGQVIDTIQLSLRLGTTNQFYGLFSNAMNGGPVIPGEYIIEVRPLWDETDYDPLEVAPVVDYGNITIHQYEIIPISARITPPETPTRIHTRFLKSMTETWALFRGIPQPFSFEVEVFNALDQKPLDLTSVFQPDQTFTGELILPSDKKIDVSLVAATNMEPQRLIGTSGSSVAEAGEYKINLVLNTIPLQETFNWAETVATAKFNREDELMTTPLVARVVLGVIAILLAGILIWLIYSLTGGPVGQIAIVKVGRNNTVTTIAGPWQLSFMPRRNRISNDTLKGLGVKALTIKRTSSLEEGIQHAVLLEAVNTADEPIFSGTLHSGLEDSFIDAGDILFTHPKEIRKT